jgi:hypothetical protein
MSDNWQTETGVSSGETLEQLAVSTDNHYSESECVFLYPEKTAVLYRVTASLPLYTLKPTQLDSLSP